MDTELKAMFFAQYLGHKVEGDFDYGDFSTGQKDIQTEQAVVEISNLSRIIEVEAYVLLLRSNDQLTDAQLLEIAVLRGYRKDHLQLVEGKELKEILSENRRYLITFNYNEVRVCIVDYLRLNGFIVPFTYIKDGKTRTLLPNEIIALGWAKLN